MKAKRLREVRELLDSDAFKSWFQIYQSQRCELREQRERRGDLLGQVRMFAFRVEYLQQAGDDTVMESGACEDRSAQAAAELAHIENESFESLSSFETQRQKTTDLWSDLSGTESFLEENRQRASDIRMKLEAGHPGAAQDRERLAAELKSLDEQVRSGGEAVAAARERLAQEEKRRDTLWREVETSWLESFRALMAKSEYAYRSRQVRSEAERLFERVQKERLKIKELEDEARITEKRLSDLEREHQELLARGRSSFDCVLVGEFLYWPSEGDFKSAFCVPLIDERDHLNIQVSALQVYHIERGKGLDLIEPVSDETEDGEDPRLESFFGDRPANVNLAEGA